jgi:epoxyqueuosine reductase
MLALGILQPTTRRQGAIQCQSKAMPRRLPEARSRGKSTEGVGRIGSDPWTCGEFASLHRARPYNGLTDTSPNQSAHGIGNSRRRWRWGRRSARESIAGKDALTLAQDILALDQDTFSAAFRKSPMKRATFRGIKRNAAVALGNMGTPDDAAVLTRARADDEPLVRDHAACALRTLRSTNS